MPGGHQEAELRTLRDAVLTSYLAWRRESEEVSATYDTWRLAPHQERGLHFDAYVAALGREERAAAHYGRLLDQATAVFQG